MELQSKSWIQEIFWKLKLWEFMLEWRRWGMNERWLRCFYNERLVDDGIEELGNIGKTSFTVEGIRLVSFILTTSIYEILQMEMFRNISLWVLAIRNVQTDNICWSARSQILHGIMVLYFLSCIWNQGGKIKKITWR